MPPSHVADFAKWRWFKSELKASNHTPLVAFENMEENSQFIEQVVMKYPNYFDLTIIFNAIKGCNYAQKMFFLDAIINDSSIEHVFTLFQHDITQLHNGSSHLLFKDTDELTRLKARFGIDNPLFALHCNSAHNLSELAILNDNLISKLDAKNLNSYIGIISSCSRSQFQQACEFFTMTPPEHWIQLIDYVHADLFLEMLSNKPLREHLNQFVNNNALMDIHNAWSQNRSDSSISLPTAQIWVSALLIKYSPVKYRLVLQHPSLLDDFLSLNLLLAFSDFGFSFLISDVMTTLMENIGRRYTTLIPPIKMIPNGMFDADRIKISQLKQHIIKNELNYSLLRYVHTSYLADSSKSKNDNNAQDLFTKSTTFLARGKKLQAFLNAPNLTKQLNFSTIQKWSKSYCSPLIEIHTILRNNLPTHEAETYYARDLKNNDNSMTQGNAFIIKYITNQPIPNFNIDQLKNTLWLNPPAGFSNRSQLYSLIIKQLLYNMPFSDFIELANYPCSFSRDAPALSFLSLITLPNLLTIGSNLFIDTRLNLSRIKQIIHQHSDTLSNIAKNEHGMYRFFDQLKNKKIPSPETLDQLVQYCWYFCDHVDLNNLIFKKSDTLMACQQTITQLKSKQSFLYGCSVYQAIANHAKTVGYGNGYYPKAINNISPTQLLNIEDDEILSKKLWHMLNPDQELPGKSPKIRPPTYPQMSPYIYATHKKSPPLQSDDKTAINEKIEEDDKNNPILSLDDDSETLNKRQRPGEDEHSAPKEDNREKKKQSGSPTLATDIQLPQPYVDLASTRFFHAPPVELTTFDHDLLNMTCDYTDLPDFPFDSPQKDKPKGTSP